jgi:predicted nucleic acid-binding protein
MKREPFVEESQQVIKLCTDNLINGCIAAHTVTNLFFILRNEKSVKERRRMLLDLCEVFDVVNLNKSKIISALENDDFKDFEDCLQDQCAADFNANYIITRNTSDFINSKVKAVTPTEFLSIFTKENNK